MVPGSSASVTHGQGSDVSVLVHLFDLVVSWDLLRMNPAFTTYLRVSLCVHEACRFFDTLVETLRVFPYTHVLCNTKAEKNA
jgi:hypothetical protein